MSFGLICPNSSSLYYLSSDVIDCLMVEPQGRGCPMLLNRCLDGNNRSIIFISHIFFKHTSTCQQPHQVFTQRVLSAEPVFSSAEYPSTTFLRFEEIERKKSWIEPPLTE